MRTSFFSIGKFMACASAISSSLGAGSNYLVEKVNDGFMPVFNALPCYIFPGVQIDYKHVCASADTHLALLVDWIRVGPSIYSIGDFFIVASWHFGYIAASFLTVAFIDYIIKRKRLFV